MQIAPAIYHDEQRPDCFEQMIQDCARNIHMRAHATCLLTYYANQADGFSPALALICRETGLSINKVHELRQQLISYGLINYSKEEKFIYISWSRIRAYAILEKPLRLTRDKCVFIPFTEKPKRFCRNRTIRSLGCIYAIKEPRQLTEEEEYFYDVLESMTESKYKQLAELIRQLEFPNIPQNAALNISGKEWVSSIEA
jgi:hypothetical protein